MNSNHFKGLLPCISSNVTFNDLSNNLLAGSISHFLCYKMNEPKNMEFLNLGKNVYQGCKVVIYNHFVLALIPYQILL